jgi:hypothetical protein
MTAPSDGPVAPPRAQGASRAAGASALWRDMVRGAASDPGFAWALCLGVALIALGLLGFIPNPIVGAPSASWGTPLLRTGDAHDVIHLVGGAVALHAALGMSRARRDGVLIGLGAAALILLALGLLDGRWFGIAPYAVSLADQLLHLVVGLGCLLMGLAGTGTIEVPIVTGAYRRAAAASVPAGQAAVPEPDTEPEAAPEAMPEAEPEAMPEADPEAMPAADPEPAAEPDTEPEAAPEADSASQAAPPTTADAPSGLTPSIDDALRDGDDTPDRDPATDVRPG